MRLTATFECKSFPLAVAFVQEIGKIAEAQDHHPDIDIRYRVVTVRTIGHIGGEEFEEKDEQLLEAIRAASKRYT